MPRFKKSLEKYIYSGRRRWPFSARTRAVRVANSFVSDPSVMAKHVMKEAEAAEHREDETEARRCAGPDASLLFGRERMT